MAIQNPVTEWAKLAEEQGWRVEHTSNGHARWLAPSGALVITQGKASSAGSLHGLQNAKSSLRAAGLHFPNRNEKKAMSRVPGLHVLPPETAPEPEPQGVTTNETAAALDAFMELVTEEMANLRRDHEDFARTTRVALNNLRDLIQTYPGIDTSAYLTKADIERAVFALETQIEAGLKKHDPLGSFRARMRAQA